MEKVAMENKEAIKRSVFTIIGNILYRVYFTVIIWFCYRTLFFKILEGRTNYESVRVLLLLVLIGNIAGFVMFPKKNQRVETFISCFVPFEIYHILSYDDSVKKVTILCIILSAIGIVSSVISTYLRRKGHKKHLLISIIRKGLIASTVVFFLPILIMFITMMGSSGLFKAKNVPKVERPTSFNSEEECLVALCRLEELEAGPKNTQEILNILQEIANTSEAPYLGLDFELTVVAKNLPIDTAAEYDDRTHTIIFDITYLQTEDPFFELLPTLCHECYHAYQHELMKKSFSEEIGSSDLLIFREIDMWRRETENYIHANVNEEDYFAQRLEVTARNYERIRRSDYYRALMEVKDE